MSSIMAQKRLLRTEAWKRREVAAANWDIGSELIKVFEHYIRPRRGATISGYYPINSEANVLPLLRVLRNRGFEIVLPAVNKPHSPLIFRLWDETTEMQEGAFGILEPGPEAISAYPDLMLVPLLAFDRRGNRLGYGGGFYDLSILSICEHKPVYALGIAYAAQELIAVPYDEQDISLDAIITEQGFIQPESEL